MSNDSMPAFEPRDGPPRRLSTPTATLLVAVAAVAALYVYDSYLGSLYFAFGWRIDALEWLFLLSVAVFLGVVAAILQHREYAARVWRRFRSDTGAVVALGVIVAVIVAGLVGPLVRPVEHNLLYTKQPPLFASVSEYAVRRCAGAMVDGRCHGSLQYPLGTDYFGRDVVALTLSGARIATMLAFIAAFLIVPLATAIGLLAGYRGGRLDAALMAGIDAQQTLPTLIVYVLLVSLSSRSLALFVVLFGLFSWGSAARLVRSETRQRAELGYVLVARNLGGDDAHLLGRHLLPNVSSAVVTAAAHLVPVLVLTEAAITYLSLTDANLLSWGRIVLEGTDPNRAPLSEQWWVSPPSVFALAAFVVAAKVAGDGLRDALDPRGER